MSHADDAAVVEQAVEKGLFYRLLDGRYVQYVGRDTATNLPIDSDGLTSVLDAAEYLGIEPKRLRGFIWRNETFGPVGDMDRVYPWSLRTIERRSEVRSESQS